MRSHQVPSLSNDRGDILSSNETILDSIMLENTMLHATLMKAAKLTDGYTVRHLLVYVIDGTREQKLVQLEDGLETTILIGTQFQTGQKADELAQKWVREEGFKWLKQGELAYEPLKQTVLLAMKMGFTVIYYPRYRKIDPPRYMNLTGEVLLTEWPGLTAKNGGYYTYAFEQMRIHAKPSLPKDHELLVVGSDSTDFIKWMQKVNEALKTIGNHAEFVLGNR